MSVPTDPNETKVQQNDEREVSLGRHKAQCSICKHPNCNDIEDAWLNWTSPAKIEFRHCHAFGLFCKRRGNIIRAYERIAERSDTVNFSGSNVLSALGILVKLGGVQKAAEGVQSEIPKATVQQIPAKEPESSAPDASPTESVPETHGAGPGQGQDGKLEAQNLGTPTVQ